MESTVAQSLKTTKKKGGTHDRKTGSGANTAPLQHGNYPHDLPNFNAGRTDFSDCKTLLKTIT